MTPDLRATYLVRSYGLLLPVYSLPTYVSGIVRNQTGDLRFESILHGKVIWVAASHMFSANLYYIDGWESNWEPYNLE